MSAKAVAGGGSGPKIGAMPSPRPQAGPWAEQAEQALSAAGYRLVTVPRLLKDDPPPAGEPIPSSLAGD